MKDASPYLTPFLWLLALPILLSSPALADVQCEPRAIDFGDRGHSERPSKTIVVKNTGSTPVRIGRLDASCGCISLQPPRILEPIPPGGSQAITVSMSSGRAMGILDKYVSISTDDRRNATLIVPVRMRVFQGFSMTPRDFRFDGVVGGDPIKKTVDVTWKGKSLTPKTFRLELEGVKTTRRPPREIPHFHGTVRDIPRGKRIELTLKPTHPEGRIWGNLQARLDGKTLVIPVAGQMFRWIKVVPTYFNFSRVSPDDLETLLESVTLTSTDGRKFKVLSMSPTFRRAAPPGTRLELSLKGTKVKESALEHVVLARIVPPAKGDGVGSSSSKKTSAKAQGSFSGVVTVQTDHPEKPTIELSFFGFFARKPQER
jgi:hypothetical protein